MRSPFIDTIYKSKTTIFFIYYSYCTGSSKHLKGLLGNRHLRDILLEIDSAKDQSKTLEYAMQIPIFTEFVDECLRVVEPDEHTTKSFMPN